MSLTLFITFAAVFATAYTAPQGISFGPDGTVGASFGGYHASAGLGGLLGGNSGQGGLFAQAGTPFGHNAAAGLGGSIRPGGPSGSTYAGASRPTTIYQPVQGTNQGSPYDSIFNIPISTLQAVNHYLNNRNAVALVPATPLYIAGRSNDEVKAVSKAESSSNSDSSAFSSSSSSSSSSASASSSSSSSTANSKSGTAAPAAPIHGYIIGKAQPTKYDNIFNIPITVLKSVNDLLNG